MMLQLLIAVSAFILVTSYKHPNAYKPLHTGIRSKTALMMGDFVYDPKRIRNFSIIAHIGMSTSHTALLHT